MNALQKDTPQSRLLVYENIFNKSPMGQAIILSNYQIVLMNNILRKALDIKDNALNPICLTDIFCESKLTAAAHESKQKSACRIIGKKLSGMFSPSPIKKKDRKPITVQHNQKWFEVFLEPIDYQNQAAALMTMIDVTDRIKEKLKLRKKAETDIATGALNKFSVMSKIDRLLAVGNCESTVCMIDFDDFKLTNDTYGHLAGDRVLKAFSESAGKHMQKNHLFGRYGGEEFIFVFTGAEEAEAISIVRRIYRNFILEYNHDYGHLTISGGLIYINDENRYINATELIGDADKLLYKAKVTGKNKIVSIRKEYALLT